MDHWVYFTFLRVGFFNVVGANDSSGLVSLRRFIFDDGLGTSDSGTDACASDASVNRVASGSSVHSGRQSPISSGEATHPWLIRGL